MLKVKEGDLGKLGLLFERYKKVLFGFFYNLNHDAAVSEDMVQNVFMRILKYKHGFNGDGDFKVWMFHIARNINIDHYKKNKNQHSEDISGWADRLSDNELNKESEIEKFESIDLLKTAIKRLDQEKQEVLTLSKLEGLKYKQIADILDCSEGAVKVKVFRALKSLKEEYLGLQHI
ncbi:MAG: RNA polymerase sigma factor [Bacteroidota bacterium]